MSRCAQGRSPTNSRRNAAAVTAPPGRPAELTMSAISLRKLLARFLVDRHRPDPIAGVGGRACCTCPPRRRRRRTAPTPRPSATMHAPVSVATSTRCVAPSRCAYHSASPRISRPSASVLMISTVLPLAPRTTSPGRIAVPPGMFSVVGMTPMTRIRRVEPRQRAHRAGDRRAAGHVVLHPLHAVGRLDRNAAGVERDALARRAPSTGDAGRRRRSWRSTMRRGGSALPCATASSSPMPSSRIRARRAPRRPDRRRVAVGRHAVGEFARRQDVGRLVGQRARRFARLADHSAAANRRVDFAPDRRPAPRPRRDWDRRRHWRGRFL